MYYEDKMDPLTEHQLFEEKRLLTIEQDIKEIHNEITKLSCDVADLVSAWQAANWMIALIKGAGAISVAMAALYTLFRGHS